MSPSPPLEPYDRTFFQHHLTQIEHFHACYLRLSAQTRPCQTCQIAILHVIADHVAHLLTMRPSEDIDEELKDMRCLDSVSRRLLKIDWQGITEKVWVLLESKIRSLATAPDFRFAVEEETFRRTARMVYVVREGGDRRDGKAMASVSRFAVVERQPRASASRSAVIEQEQTTTVPGLNVVDQQPRTSVSAFNVVERQPNPTVPGINIAPVARDRAPSSAQQPAHSIASLRIDPSVAVRMIGSLRGIITELESSA
ncbi:MAG: hypothetical protein Q9173_006257 [Seirophora scorigena]